MRLIPALDLKGGLVVRGVGGRRAEYRPWVSPLCGSAAPPVVARALAGRAGARELYVADLDAIGGAAPNTIVLAQLREIGAELWVDAGLADVEGAAVLDAAGVVGLVAGLESVCGPGALARLLDRFGPDRVVFSLDLKAGRPCSNPAWPRGDANAVAERAIELGARRLIVLDLARVGEAGGTGTLGLCRALAETHPDVEVIAGGGVRDRGDLERLEECGVRAALVATALHEGRL